MIQSRHPCHAHRPHAAAHSLTAAHVPAGWSVYRMIHLRREPGVKPQDGKYPSLGEMLIQRANAGVRVCLLVWDDKTSLGAPLMRTEGLMLVHDEDNAKFFDNTKVRSVC